MAIQMMMVQSVIADLVNFEKECRSDSDNDSDDDGSVSYCRFNVFVM